MSMSTTVNSTEQDATVQNIINRIQNALEVSLLSYESSVCKFPGLGEPGNSQFSELKPGIPGFSRFLEPPIFKG